MCHQSILSKVKSHRIQILYPTLNPLIPHNITLLFFHICSKTRLRGQEWFVQYLRWLSVTENSYTHLAANVCVAWDTARFTNHFDTSCRCAVYRRIQSSTRTKDVSDDTNFDSHWITSFEARATVAARRTSVVSLARWERRMHSSRLILQSKALLTSAHCLCLHLSLLSAENICNRKTFWGNNKSQIEESTKG